MRSSTQRVLRSLTRIMRPLALRSAGKAGSKTSVVRHVGRTSGKTYDTPVVVAEDGDTFLVALPYGERTDWLKNVLASGRAVLLVNGQTHEVADPALTPMADATRCFRPKEQRLHTRFHVTSALRLRRI